MVTIFINNSLNDTNEVYRLKVKLHKIHIQYETDKYGLNILVDNTGLVGVFNLFVGRPIVFSIIE